MDFLRRALESLPTAASSPLALVAYVFTVAAWSWASNQIWRLKTVRDGMKDVPESQRPVYLRTTLNRVVPSSISASDWIKSERQKYLFCLLLSGIFLVLCLAALSAWKSQNAVNVSSTVNNGLIVTLSGSPGAKVEISPALPKATTLVLTESKKGWQTIDGSIHEFMLSNPLAGLAIVESIEVEMLDVVEDKWATTQSLIDTYRFSVELAPESLGLKKFADNFKYSPGEVDRISVLLRSRGGFDYFVRFVVTWDDVLRNSKTKTYSDVQIARFPSSDNPQSLDLNAMGRGSEEHSADLERRLAALRKKLQ